MNQSIKKADSLSVSKVILGTLWKLGGSSRENILSGRYYKNLCKDKNKSTYRSSIFRLIKSGRIRAEYNNILVLTEFGKREAMLSFLEAEANLLKNDTQKWDGGWRIIFFDIPEKKRKYRDYLRKIIKKIGFREFQKSIWIYPYPVPGFLKELIFDHPLKNHIKFITTTGMQDDFELRKTFDLSRKL